MRAVFSSTWQSNSGRLLLLLVWWTCTYGVATFIVFRSPAPRQEQQGSICSQATASFTVGDWPMVLASYPGSGNTWMRLVVEQAIQMVTGSIYKDKHMAETFEAEGHVEQVVLVKSHAPWHGQLQGHRLLLPVVRGAVHIVRHPYTAIPSYWSWTESLLRAPPVRLGPLRYIMGGPLERLVARIRQPILDRLARQRWEAWRHDHAEAEAHGWLAHTLYWQRLASSANVPVLVVRYEDMTAEPVETLTSVLRFVRQLRADPRAPSPETDEAMVQCAVDHQERTHIHRKHSWYPRFTAAQKSLVYNITNAEPHRVLDLYGYSSL